MRVNDIAWAVIGRVAWSRSHVGVNNATVKGPPRDRAACPELLSVTFTATGNA